MNGRTRFILQQAANLIERKGLAKGTFARLADGSETNFKDENAACYCALGAVRAACWQEGFGYEDWGPADRALAATVGATGTIRGVARWNDDPNRTQAEVVATFRKAAEALP